MLVSTPKEQTSSSEMLLLVTYEAMAELSIDDQLLLNALIELGVPAKAAVWNDPTVRWNLSRAAVLRSTWDYFHQPAHFRDWIRETSTQTELINGPEMLLWNMHKAYLEELAERGVPTVPTLMLKMCDGTRGLAAILSTGWEKIVIKPAISGSAYKTKVFEMGRKWDEAVLRQHIEDIQSTSDAMIQFFVPSVFTHGERSLVYLGGTYSHAFKKAPFSAGAAGGESKETLLLPSDEELRFCSGILGKLSIAPLYARVDIIPHDGELLLMELELIEPALQFGLWPGSAHQFAKLLADRTGLAMRPQSEVGPEPDS